MDDDSSVSEEAEEEFKPTDFVMLCDAPALWWDEIEGRLTGESRRRLVQIRKKAISYQKRMDQIEYLHNPDVREQTLKDRFAEIDAGPGDAQTRQRDKVRVAAQAIDPLIYMRSLEMGLRDGDGFARQQYAAIMGVNIAPAKPAQAETEERPTSAVWNFEIFDAPADGGATGEDDAIR